MTETVCPLCNTPRPRGAKRCVCNYTFEFDAPGRGAGAQTLRAERGTGRAGTAVSGVAGAVVAAALVAAAVAYYFGADLDHRAGSGNAAMWLLVPAGAFSIAGGAADWSWFLGNRRARLFVALFGRTGARVIYGVLGGVLIGLGASLALAG